MLPLQKCPFDAILIINLPRNLAKETTHRYGVNSFKLHRWVARQACRPVSLDAGGAMLRPMQQRAGIQRCAASVTAPTLCNMLLVHVAHVQMLEAGSSIGWLGQCLCAALEAADVLAHVSSSLGHGLVSVGRAATTKLQHFEQQCCKSHVSRSWHIGMVLRLGQVLLVGGPFLAIPNQPHADARGLELHCLVRLSVQMAGAAAGWWECRAQIVICAHHHRMHGHMRRKQWTSIISQVLQAAGAAAGAGAGVGHQRDRQAKSLTGFEHEAHEDASACSLVLQAAGAAARPGAGAGGHQWYRQVHSAEDPGGQAQAQPGAARGVFCGNSQYVCVLGWH